MKHRFSQKMSSEGIWTRVGKTDTFIKAILDENIWSFVKA